MYKGAPLRVFELKGSLYGQKDAPLRWFTTLKGYLQSIGFQRSANDACLYNHKQRNVSIVVHVDDVLCRGTRTNSQWLWTKLKSEYALKQWGEPHRPQC